MTNIDQYSLYLYFFRYSNNNTFKIVEDNYVILEFLNNHLTSFSFLQYNIEDQVKLFGFTTILSYISPVGLGFISYIFK